MTNLHLTESGKLAECVSHENIYLAHFVVCFIEYLLDAYRPSGMDSATQTRWINLLLNKVTISVVSGKHFTGDAIEFVYRINGEHSGKGLTLLTLMPSLVNYGNSTRLTKGEVKTYHRTIEGFRLGKLNPVTEGKFEEVAQEIEDVCLLYNAFSNFLAYQTGLTYFSSTLYRDGVIISDELYGVEVGINFFIIRTDAKAFLLSQELEAIGSYLKHLKT